MRVYVDNGRPVNLVFKDSAEYLAWATNQQLQTLLGSETMTATSEKKPRPHAEVIKAWADGKSIECRSCITGAWVDCPVPAWMDESEYRVKPTPPEKAYPKTLMSDDELMVAWQSPPTALCYGNCNRNLANAAIRYAIDKGQVVPLSEIASYTDKRDMAIANAMKAEAIRISNIYSTGLGRYLLDYIDVNATVAGMKP